jgi:hypothetical protein
VAAAAADASGTARGRPFVWFVVVVVVAVWSVMVSLSFYTVWLV